MDNLQAWSEYVVPSGPWLAASQAAIGNDPPYNLAIRSLHQAIADPQSQREGPGLDRNIDGSSSERERVLKIPYWTALLTLTWGCLGWVRPDVGAQRWITAGQPAPDGQSALVVLKRWWGAEVEMLIEWTAVDGNIPEGSDVVNELVGGRPTLSWMAPLRPRVHRWPEVTEGGSDPLHLTFRARMLLCDGGERSGATLVVQQGQRGRSAVLILDNYAGWYRQLAEKGAELPRRSDGRHWEVDVVVRPLGWLGKFRRSDVTGRWFTGQHRWHMLGWNGPARD